MGSILVAGTKTYQMNRITTILGAGAVLDFDFGNLLRPTTQNITDAILDIEVQNVDGQTTKLIKAVHDRLQDRGFEKRNPEITPYAKEVVNKIHFEHLFHVLEELMSYNSIWKSEWILPSIYPPLAAFCKGDFERDTIEYERALIKSEDKILQIITDYDNQFSESTDKERWYKEFWKRNPKGWDIFNLNYDTTVEQSLGEYEDGYEDTTEVYQHFSPTKLMLNRNKLSTVQHLHGSILYAEAFPMEYNFSHGNRDLYKFPTAKSAREEMRIHQCPEHTQAHESFYTGPILVGLRKTEKLEYLPYSCYHADLVNKIVANPSLMIVGYSFGDLYVDQLLERHKLVHGKNQRVVLIDKWPDWMNKDSASVCLHLMNITNGKLRLFLERLLDKRYDPCEAKKYLNLISDGCWESYNGVIRICTKGFKHAVECNGEEILGFLRVSNT